MNNTLKAILKYFGWFVLLAAFASIGFATDNPALMVPLYFLFFVIVFGLVLLYNMRRHKRETVTPAYMKHVRKVLGFVLLLASIFTPFFLFRGIGFTAGIYILLSVIIILLIALVMFAVRMINKEGFLNNLIGYVILIVVCSMPALIMMQHDRTYHALGLAYYSALIISVLAWSGISILGSYIKI